MWPYPYSGCEWFVCLRMAGQKNKKIRDIQISLDFLKTNLRVVLVGFLLLCSKVKADAINDLQNRRAKIATKSEMFVKNGHKVYFWKKYKYKHRVPKICTINEPKMGNFQDYITILYKRCFVLSWTFFMAGEQWISGFVWH